MGEQQQKSLEEAVRSYAHWWREAGLHTAIEAEPHGWRQGLSAPFWQRDAASAPEAARPVAAVLPRIAEAVAPRIAPAPTGMPDTLPAFLDWLAGDAHQPEAAWDSPLILPPAESEAKLLMLVEMPAATATEAASLFDPGQRRFLEAMLASIGIGADKVAFAALATRRPPGGLLDEETLGKLTARMTHYLGLARPRTAIILGDRTSRALIGSQWRPSAEGLQKINHPHGTISTLALASAELLMSRPAAKARSWQALRLLPGAWI